MNWSIFKNILIFIIVAIVVAAGAFVYNQFKSGQDTPAENETPSKGVTIINNNDAGNSAVETSDSLTATSTATSTDMMATSTPSLATSTEAVTTATSTLEKLPDSIDKSDVVLNILNGNGVTGITTKAAKIMTDAGYKVASKGNAANFNFATTEITYSADVADNAEAIDQLLGGGSTMTEDAESNGKIVITLGKNFK